MTELTAITLTRIDGQNQTLADYHGKALLIVNVASECGLTPQYQALEALYQAHRDDGLEILAFPCNQFGGQEPGSETEIQGFCQKNYGVSFPLFSKIEVNGAHRHPLYQALLAAIPERTAAADSTFVAKLKNYGIEGKDGDILWNFEKFVISRQGEVIAHFAPDMTPDHPLLQAAVSQALQG